MFRSHNASLLVSSTAPTVIPTLAQPSHTFELDDLSSFDVNATHFRLFSNLCSPVFLGRGYLDTADYIPAWVYLRYAQDTPYLLHQLLAASAFHLSISQPKETCFYRHYAIGLQTRALGLFNDAHPNLVVTTRNCKQLFLFASLTAVCLLVDALHAEVFSVEGFCTQFADSLGIYRGVVIVLSQAQGLLEDIELGASLKLTRNAMSLEDGFATECDGLREMLACKQMDPALHRSCEQAVYQLDRIFLADRTSTGRLPSAVFSWPALLDREYIAGLGEGQAECLIIFAHYAILLHRGRHMWLLGGTGRRLITAIAEALAQDQIKWLRVPLEAIALNDGIDSNINATA